jgi:microsomal dipeptidase-like Zn-dependent dipeptidase
MVTTGPRIVLALEDLGSVGAVYDAGIRSAGLTYNAGNPLGGGLGQQSDGGLTPIGVRRWPS